MQMNMEKESCPYCGETMYLNVGACEYFCPDCRKSFGRITGQELDENGHMITDEVENENF